MPRLLLASILLLAAGCVLQTEACGPDYREFDGRCVPRDAPPAGRPDGAPALPDGAIFEDASSIPADADVPIAEWAPYDALWIVDATPIDRAESTPATPGADIDSVAIVLDGVAYWGTQILRSRVNDPFGVSEASNPAALLGPPDWSGELGDPGGLVSVGGEGGWVWLGFSLPRALRAGDEVHVIEITPLAAGEEAESVTVSLCRSSQRPPEGCRPLRGAGVDRLAWTLP